MILKDTKTGKRYKLDFVWFAFPGLQHEGYRIEGLEIDEEKWEQGINNEFIECVDLGSLIISDRQAKIVNW